MAEPDPAGEAVGKPIDENVVSGRDTTAAQGPARPLTRQASLADALGIRGEEPLDEGERALPVPRVEAGRLRAPQELGEAAIGIARFVQGSQDALDGGLGVRGRNLPGVRLPPPSLERRERDRCLPEDLPR